MNWRKFFGYAFASAALVWVFHDVNPSQIAAQLRDISWWWLIPAVAADVLSYTCDGARWSLLLRPIGDLPVLRAVQAIYAGLFTNEVVPLRFGELVRAYLASRWIERPIVHLVPSMVAARLIDGVWLATGFAVLLFFVPLPADLARAGNVFGVVMAALAVLFILLALRPVGRARRWAERPDLRMRSVLGRMLVGLGEIGLGRNLSWAGVFSLGLLLLQAAAFWFVMIACKLPVTYAGAATVFLIVRLGTALPNAPANVGSFQFFTVLGLQLFGVAKAPAAAFSVIVFLVLTLPLWAIGLFAISNSGVSLSRIRAELRESTVS